MVPGLNKFAMVSTVDSSKSFFFEPFSQENYYQSPDAKIHIKPGVYYLDYPINIVQTVARCGGFTEWSKSKITLVRKEPKKDKKLFKGNTLLFDYGDFLDGTDLEKNVFIEAGDIVIVN